MIRKLKSVSLLMLIAVAGYGAEFTTRTYPLTVNVEKQYFQSAIYLRLEVKDYNQPFEVFAASAHDPYEATFTAFVTAVRNNDNTAAVRLLLPSTMHATGDTVKLYRAAFDGMRDITVISQVLVGSKHLFMWRANSGSRKFVRAFAVEEGSLKVGEVTSDDPLSVIIVNNVMDAMRTMPEAYRTLATRPTPFEYRLPVQNVAMQFGGAAPEVKRTATLSAGPAPGILKLYTDTAEALRLQAVDQFLSHFTARSAEVIKKYLATASPEHFSQIPNLAWETKHVRLVIGSDPVYIVFYTMGDNAAYRYDYVVRDAGTNELKFANIDAHLFLDDVLSRRELFDPARVIASQRAEQ